ncbi:MAG: DUF5916 domain-containing protein [Planctomycetota bacterium]
MKALLVPSLAGVGLLCAVSPLRADEIAPRVQAVRFAAAPEIDGDPSEEVWRTAGLIDRLTQVEPLLAAEPSQRTEVRIGYDLDCLYIALYCYDDDPGGIIATQPRRDANLDPDDRVEIILDTFHDHRNAYFFQIGPAGSRGDALIANNGNSFNKQWDTYWEGKARITEAGWFAEISIPFRSLSFDPQNSVWGLNLVRQLKRFDEEDRWASPSRDWGVFRISTAGELYGLEGMRQGLGINVKPYGKLKWSNDRESSRQFTQGDLGGDVIWRATPNLTWTFTVNTDFAETEVDERRVNLTRFPLFFPEKREFFLEDASIFEFGPGGFHDSRDLVPFFSRRIGLDENGEEVPILAGTKLTGRAGDFNIGVLDVETGATDGLDPKNLFASRISRNIWDESSVGLIMTRGDPTTSGQNGVIGFDLNYVTSEYRGDKSLRASAFALKSFTSGAEGDGTAYGGNLSYPNDLWSWSLDAKAIGSEFNPAMGFVRRRGIRQYSGNVAYRPRPGDSIRQLTFLLAPSLTTTEGNDLDSWSFRIEPLGVELETGDDFEVFVTPQFETFDEPFEIEDGIIVPGDDYHTLRYGAEFSFSDRRPLSGGLEVSTGTFLTGRLDSVGGALVWRPGAAFGTALEYEYEDVDLAEGSFDVHIARGRFEINFSPELSWNNFVQWDNLSEDLGLNSRLRFIPSDGRELFLVYNKSWLRDGSSLTPDGEEVTIKAEYVLRF